MLKPEDVDLAPFVLAVGVVCWVAGFDLIYATQDFEFDRREGIRSLVVKLGIARSLRLAQLLHLLLLVALIGFGFAPDSGQSISSRCCWWRPRSFSNIEARARSTWPESIAHFFRATRLSARFFWWQFVLTV